MRARSLNARAMAWKAAKSVRVCHGGSMAGVKACTNGCMSVEDRSCFSYQVAAGSTMSENSVVDVIRKSSDSSRSSLPRGASSGQATPSGRLSGGACWARTAESAPSRWRRKYSLPLAEEPSRLARHTVSTRGQFAGGVGVLAGEAEPPGGDLPRHVRGRVVARLVGQVERVAVERRIRRHPPQPGRLRQQVRGGLPGEDALGER
ncbi:hypothetical protein GCM10020001_110650 [Nonomuraea salmonea]